MSGTDIKSMFESIKESLNAEKQSGNSSFKNFLKMEVGKTYLVRFIPNIVSPKETFFHYSHHGWTSLSTGSYVDGICLRTFNERCPICEARFKLYKTKKPEDKDLAYMLRSYDKHLVNVYVISDPTTPENEGTIKILRFGKRVYDKVLAATEGDDAEEFGPRIYDLSENGCNFKIKVESSSENNRKFTNYNNSRFTAPSAIPNLDSKKVKDIYDNIFDLSKIIEVQSADDLANMLQTHAFSGETKPPSSAKPSTEVKEDSDDIPFNNTPVSEPPASKSTTQDEKIKNLLEGLDNL